MGTCTRQQESANHDGLYPISQAVAHRAANPNFCQMSASESCGSPIARGEGSGRQTWRHKGPRISKSRAITPCAPHTPRSQGRLRDWFEAMGRDGMVASDVKQSTGQVDLFCAPQRPVFTMTTAPHRGRISETESLRLRLAWRGERKIN